MLREPGPRWRLPLLDAMVPALTALSQTAAAPARLRRLGVFYVPNGMSMGYWWPEAEGPLTAMPAILQSLSPLKDRVLLLGGLRDEPREPHCVWRRPRAVGRHLPDGDPLQADGGR